MGFNFRKSFKVAPGIKLNVSKSGLSTTVGKKGFTVSHGKKGTRLNASIPGAGIFYQTSLTSKKSTNNNNNFSTSKLTDEYLVSEKNKIVAIVLCIFLGWFGVHRFYTGHIKLGFVYLFSMGICGLGVLIDLILLCTHNYKDSLGNVLE